MSYILDALKKLEKDKQKKTRGDGIESITGALFKDVPRRTSGGNNWKIAAVVVVASLATFGATWFLLKSGKGVDSLKSRQVVQQTPVVKPAPVPAPLPVQPPPLQAPVSQPQAPAVIPAGKPPIAPSAVSDDEDSPTYVSKRQAKSLNERKGKVVRPAKDEKPAISLVAAPADIKVSGIAWQDERRARRAVVNGFLMQEGASVSGARITEIFQDRVRFSQDNKVFEIPLMSSGLPGGGK